MVQKHTSTQKICSCPFSLHHIFYLILGPSHESLTNLKHFYLHSALQAPMKAATCSFPPPSSADKSAHICLNKKRRGRRGKKNPFNISSPCMNAFKKPGKASTVFFFFSTDQPLVHLLKLFDFQSKYYF